MSAGRSRGRAKVPARAEPSVPTPAASTSAASAQLPPATRLPSSTTTRLVPETGRGRGIANIEQQASHQSTVSTTTASNVSNVSPTGDNGSGSGSGSGSSETTPPQQHSPPHIAVGRAALRGGPHQPNPNIRSNIITEMDRLALQDTGDVAPTEPKREPARIESVLYTRPTTCETKLGTVGKKTRILCNFFEILQHPNWILYQYHVDYLPVIESKRMRIALFKDHEHLFPTNKAFDGSTLYSLTKLHDEVTEVASKRTTDDVIIQIKIKRIAEIAPTSPNFIHLFNLVFRKCLKLYGMKEIDRNFFDMNNKIAIPEYRINLINGFATSIASYDNEKLLLCAELMHKILHSVTIYELMREFYNDARGDEGRFREHCAVELIGKIIMTKYNDKTYKIADIDWSSSPMSTFDYRGEQISFVDYYKKNYEKVIEDTRQPLLVIQPNARDKRRGQTTPILLVPEFCIVTGVSEKMRTDFRFKKRLEEFAKVDAGQRCDRLSHFVNNFKTRDVVKAELDKWKMDFQTKPFEIDGRTLPPETISYGDNRLKTLNEKADWSFDIKTCPVFKCIPLKRWIIFYPNFKRNAANNFLNLYSQVLRGMGLFAEEPVEVSLANDNPDVLVTGLKQHIKDDIQLVVVLVSNKRKDRYDAIKRICCLEKPVPSQVCTTQLLEDERKGKSVVTKIALQMNCKLGGELWAINIPIKNIMICGIDTYHDSATKRGSVCAFIATSNDSKTRFFSRATIQETHQELSNNLTLNVKSACEHYRKINGVFPEKIIIYRDGISDGQLPMVMDYEIPQIEKAFNLADSNYMPKMSFVVVKKRGNARFFYKTPTILANPECGTVIDNGVTRPEWFDFYLISQHVTQGTVNPTHYNIIYDTIGLKPDHYQRLSFKLCHMYYNWPGTIRVPALCQYAHKLAFLVGQSLHREHHTSLCDKLFYL